MPGFVAGAHRSDSFALSLEDIALSNQLGLLAPLADRSDTSTESFAMAAESYLGESNAIGIMADNVIDSINQRFATAVEISKMGVEGFDAFAYGAEDFFENVKNFFKMIAAAFKKLIQTVTNFCKMVINWVRGQVAKTQTKFYTDNKDKIKNMTDESKGKLVKVRVPNKEGPKAVANSFMKPIKDYNDSVDKHLNEALKINVFGEGVSGITRAKTYTVINRVTNSTHEFNPDVYLEFDYKGKKINITSKTKPADVGAYLVFGDNKKKEMRTAAFIKGIGGEAGIASYLSEDALKVIYPHQRWGLDVHRSKRFSQVSTSAPGTAPDSDPSSCLRLPDSVCTRVLRPHSCRPSIRNTREPRSAAR